MPNSKKKLTKRTRRKLDSYCIGCGGLLDPDTYVCVQCTTPKKTPKGTTSQEPPLTPDAMTAVLKAAYDAGLAEGRKEAPRVIYQNCPIPCSFCSEKLRSISYAYSDSIFRPGTYTEPQ